MRTCLFLTPVLLLGCAFAQQPLVGRIQGVVRDQAKAPVAEVALTATNLDSNSNRASVTDGGGAYQFVDLPPGRYSITAQKDGYRSAKVEVVTVASGQVVNVDLALPRTH